METHTCDAEVIAQLAESSQRADVSLHVPFSVARRDSAVIDLEQFCEFPKRRQASLTFSELESFTRYVAAYKEEATIITISPETSALTAIIDYHSTEENGWKRHKASFIPVFTDEWNHWTKKNKVAMNQQDFAAFLEDGLRNIVKPAAAEFLDIARTLEAKTSVNFKGGVRLTNGDHSLTFEETTTAKAGAKGDLEIPSEFVISARPYLGHKPVAITARLRYRLNDGRISFWFELLDMDLVRDQIRHDVAEQVQKLTDITPFVGAIN